LVSLGLFKADSPQRSWNLDHVSVTAWLCCPRCKATKVFSLITHTRTQTSSGNFLSLSLSQGDIWNENYDCCTHHHRRGLLEAVELLRGSLNESDFLEAKKHLGFHGNPSLFKGLNFDPFLQTACEPYHLLFLGILRFFFK